MSQERSLAQLEADFAAVARRAAHRGARAPGYLRSHLMHRGEEADVDDTRYHVVIAFDSQAHLDAWQVSEEQALGPGSHGTVRGGHLHAAQRVGTGNGFRGPRMATPPRWKIAVVTWLGICPIVVSTMTWVVAPALTRLFRPWLNPVVPSVFGTG